MVYFPGKLLQLGRTRQSPLKIYFDDWSADVMYHVPTNAYVCSIAEVIAPNEGFLETILTKVKITLIMVSRKQNMPCKGAIIMKAAVLHQFGEVPRYEDFPDPIAGVDEILVHVKAVGLENVDKMVAAGTHFASRKMMPNLPAVVSFDGIGTLEDGRLVGFGGVRPPYGSMADVTVIPKAYFVPVPDGVDAPTAATVPASAMTGLFPLKWGGKMQPGDTVLINGATGFAGKLAVQIAKLLGAGRIVGSGRDEAALQSMRELGADDVIDLKQSDDNIREAFTTAAGEKGYHIILDFLWGHPTELLLETLTPHEFSFAKHPIRLIQIGEMGGATISLAAEALRTSGLEIVGGAAGLTPEAMGEGTQQVWEWLQAGKLRADIECVPLKDIEAAWGRTVHGKRLVIVP
jgi:NADPH2:quinone reductase